MGIEKMERIVVVGSSLAGLRTIEALRRRGHEGEIVALSAESDWPYDRPPLSKQFLKGDWEIDKLSLRRQGFDDLGVEWRLGVSAHSLDLAGRRVALSTGDSVEYDGLVLATGASPRMIPGMADREGVHVLRSLEDARGLRAALDQGGRLVVIGAGFIGMEVAASARERGLEVVVIEAMEAPLLRGLGRRLGELVGQRHRDHGVDLRCGVGVQGLLGEGAVSGLSLSDGSTLEAQNVLVGIGVVPEVAWLEGSGLEVDNGILCDATGATSTEGVVAVGDCARWFSPRRGEAVRHEHWTSAVEQSEVAATRLLCGAAEAKPLDSVAYVWSDQFEMRLALVGEPAAGDTMHVSHGALNEDRFLALLGRQSRLVGAVSMKRPRPLNVARGLLEKGASLDEAIEAVG
ncbi:MAG: FAD-dependent oxidoreductase [Myxococcota bacterium]|nr:FAD-dependent oxidoreductase [Myxococcota bacterium]